MEWVDEINRLQGIISRAEKLAYSIESNADDSGQDYMSDIWEIQRILGEA